jgi:hypothetical protein
MILVIMQFSIIYSAKLLVKYAAYVSCRVGIVNYSEAGTFDVEKIRYAAIKCLSPIVRPSSEKKAKGFFNTGSEADNESRMKNAGVLLDVELPASDTSFNIQNVRKPNRSPGLTVKLVYRYKPVIPLIKNIFYSAGSETGRDSGGFIELRGEATMPVELGQPFTPGN